MEIRGWFNLAKPQWLILPGNAWRTMFGSHHQMNLGGSQLVDAQFIQWRPVIFRKFQEQASE